MMLLSRVSSSLCRYSRRGFTLASIPRGRFLPLSSNRALSTLPRTPLFEAISQHDPQSTAIVHSLSGRSFTYGSLLQDVADAKRKLVKDAGRSTIKGERIAFLVENSYDYVVTLLSVLGSNAIAVPLSPSFPAGELRYILEQSEALVLLSSAKFSKKANEVLKEEMSHKLISVSREKILEGGSSDQTVTLENNPRDQDMEKGGMMLYTSGTTNRPKGVLLPQDVLTAQSKSLLEAWRYTPQDHLLHVLPLHHIHGTVNAILTPLMAGSTIEFMYPFTPDNVWKRFAAPFLPPSNKAETIQSPPPPPSVTFFTVVPTIYTRLLQTHGSLSPALQSATREALKPRNLRLNISGSAALPTPTKQAWQDLSGGNVLLERYGMTEVGMALSCGLDFADRVDGSVGTPLPSVTVRLVDTETGEVIPEEDEGDERQGEIQLKGPTIFREYWRNPTATKSEFTDDGFFKTGDVAVRRAVTTSAPISSNAEKETREENNEKKNEEKKKEKKMYFILGRQSTDIIKSGGEKISALEVEREILSCFPDLVAECAVVGLPSETLGQKVAAVVVLLPEDSASSSSSSRPHDLRHHHQQQQRQQRQQQQQQQQQQQGEVYGKEEEEAAAEEVEAEKEEEACVIKQRPRLTKHDLRRRLKPLLAPFKLPTVLKVLDAQIPRNAMGKVNKKSLVREVFASSSSSSPL